MATNTQNAIIGTVGNLVFYTMNGKNYIRTKPRRRKKKRGEAPNPMTVIFGTVSRNASQMGKGMKGFFLFPFTLSTYNHLRSWMRNLYAAHGAAPEWELKAEPNSSSQLNTETSLWNLLQTNIGVSDEGDGNIMVNIPALNPMQHIKAPHDTTKVNMKLVVAHSAFTADKGPSYEKMEEYSFDYVNSELPSRQIRIDAKFPGFGTSGHIAIVVLALEFETNEMGRARKNSETRWLPAAVVAMGRLK